jgi:hypothetical protein
VETGQRLNQKTTGVRLNDPVTRIQPFGDPAVAEATAEKAEAMMPPMTQETGQCNPLMNPLSPDLSKVLPELLSLCLDQNLAKIPHKPAGRIRHFLPNWHKISNDKILLNTVTGLELEWLNKPTRSQTVKGPNFSQSERILINNEIKAMIQKGAIQPTLPSHPQFVGHIFLRPKKDGGMRPVFNMKALNHHIEYKHFKMENLSMLKNILQKHDFMVKLDLKDAYFCVPINPKDRPFLRFQWEEILYEFTCLPFGLSSAPRQFTKLMKPVISVLRRLGVRILIYLDDILILNQNKMGLMKDTHSLIFLLHNLGLVINWEKSILSPTQDIEYLGMKIDSNSMQLLLPQTKIDDIKLKCKQMLSENQTTVHKLTKLIGTLTSTIQAIQPGPLHYRGMQMLRTTQLLRSQTYAAKISLNPQCKTELRWWLLHMETWNGRAIITSGPDMIIQTDASSKGWGAYQEGRPTSTGINGLWSKTESRLHINCLELKAAELAVQTFAKEKFSLHIHLKMDNITALTHINKLGGTKSQQLTEITKSLWEFCLRRNIHLTAEYLPGSMNSIADKLSRQFQDSSNWRLNPQLFASLNNRWGPLEIDLFADRLNAQTQTYFSWKQDPLAAGTDAFLWPWKKRCYAFPPFCMIGRCLMKVQKEKTDLVLIAPAWQGQHWYPILLNLLIEEPILLPMNMETLQSQTQEPHPMLQNNSLHLVAWKVSGNREKILDFQSKQPNSSLKDGAKAQDQLTMHPGIAGQAGVINGKLILFKPLWPM